VGGGVKTGQTIAQNCIGTFSKFLEALKLIELVDFTILFEEEIPYV